MRKGVVRSAHHRLRPISGRARQSDQRRWSAAPRPCAGASTASIASRTCSQHTLRGGRSRAAGADHGASPRRDPDVRPRGPPPARLHRAARPQSQVQHFSRCRRHPSARRAAIAPGAPSSVRGHAPFSRLLAAARTTSVATRFSRDAGKYLCNYIYWRALEAAAKSDGPRRAVFIHVPPIGKRFRPHGRSRRRPFTPDQLFRAGRAILLALSRR